MYQEDNPIYQRIIRTLRRLNSPTGWPGKSMSAPAVSRYPNIAAEILAFSGYLWCPAEYAGISNGTLNAFISGLVERGKLDAELETEERNK